jgi:hypothetical protein
LGSRGSVSWQNVLLPCLSLPCVQLLQPQTLLTCCPPTPSWRRAVTAWCSSSSGERHFKPPSRLPSPIPTCCLARRAEQGPLNGRLGTPSTVTTVMSRRGGKSHPILWSACKYCSRQGRRSTARCSSSFHDHEGPPCAATDGRRLKRRTMLDEAAAASGPAAAGSITSTFNATQVSRDCISQTTPDTGPATSQKIPSKKRTGGIPSSRAARLHFYLWASAIRRQRQVDEEETVGGSGGARRLAGRRGVMWGPRTSAGGSFLRPCRHLAMGKV